MSSIPQFFPGLPDYPAITALRDFRQWVAWAWKKKPDGSFTKPPINPHTGFGASHSNPLQWGSYDEALARAQRDHLAGIGFVLEPGDDLTGSDLDDCRDPVSGSLEPWAAKIVALRETYTEVSPSGCGIRMMWKGKIESAIKCDPAHVEIYCRSRYLTITGQHVAGTPFEILPAPKTLAALRARVAEFREPDVMPSSASNGATGQSGNSGRSDFRDINDRAMAELGAWVPYVFPRARFQPATRAWRVTSADLGRNLEEDLSLAPNGIVDFGVADIGDPRQGKRTPIDIVLEFGGAANVLDAAKWLADRVGGENPFTPDPVAAESQANLARRAPKAAVKPLEPEPETELLEPDIPSSGVLGQLIDYGLKAVEAPHQWFSFGIAISVLSSLVGRCWHAKIGPHSTHANLYLTILASSSFGKTSYLNAFLSAVNASDANRFIGASSIASAPGLRKMMEIRGNTLCTIDEIGGEFGRILNRRAQPHDAQIKSYMLSLFSASPSIWSGTAYGEGETETIYNPCLSLLGFSTPTDFWRRFSEEQVRDGLLPRFLFVEARGEPNFVDSPLFLDVPQSVVDAIHSIVNARANVQRRGPGNIASSINWGTMKPNMQAVLNEEGVEDLRREAKREERKYVLQAERDGESIKVPFLARSVEMATKLALITAVGDNPDRPMITRDGFVQATKIAAYLIGTAASHVSGDDIFESEFGRQNKQEMDRTIATVKKLSGKGGVALNTVVRRLRHHQKARDTNEIIGLLSGDGLVIIWTDEETGVKMINWRR